MTEYGSLPHDSWWPGWLLSAGLMAFSTLVAYLVTLFE
jgi:hypothetical protein